MIQNEPFSLVYTHTHSHIIRWIFPFDFWYKTLENVHLDVENIWTGEKKI